MSSNEKELIVQTISDEDSGKNSFEAKMKEHERGSDDDFVTTPLKNNFLVQV